MDTNRTLRVGITLGDPNGVGPEIALKAVHRHGWPPNWTFALIGPAAVLSEQARRFHLPMPSIASPIGPWPSRQRVVAWDVGEGGNLRWRPGHISVAAACASIASLRMAYEAVRTGCLDAMVTAPIHKGAWGRAGVRAPGHTELLAEWCGTRRFAMLLTGGRLRVVLVTRHIPLRQVSAVVTRSTVAEAIEQGHAALQWMGCRRKRIAVCGLNPHAGDEGRLGDEERLVIEPAIRAARRKGWDVVGPVSGDVAFRHAYEAHYDLVVAMYHDQGLAPLKLHAFETGVNLTLGLPFVRTSPDHGTAFDIAGRGKADPRSMCAAIRLAGELALRPNPWRKKE